MLICPVCGAALARVDKTFTCVNGHSFDIAREGYVNLLRKPHAGDTREMVLARRRFLERGLYLPLSDAVNDTVGGYLAGSAAQPPGSRTPCVLDVGCGEGYYLGRLAAYLKSRFHTEPCLFGMDVSKEAIRLAAKRYPDICFVVANTWEQVPFATGSIRVLLNVFAPRNPREFARVVAPGGLLLVVIPGPNHLAELRSTYHLLEIEENKQASVVEQFAEAFDCTAATTLAYDIALSGAEAAELIAMTPNYWHEPTPTTTTITEAARQTRVEFVLLQFRRKADDKSAS